MRGKMVNLGSPIKVLIVDGSIVSGELLTDLLNKAADIQVVGKATNGKQAIAMNQRLKPNLITIDVQMPGLDGFTVIEEIMATHPVPILVVTSSRNDIVDLTFRSLSSGALDLVEKPDLDGSLAEALRHKIRLLAGICVVHRIRKKRKIMTTEQLDFPVKRRPIVAIASSTGGPKVLLDILMAIPRDFSGCILVTQHMADGFNRGFIQWLDSELSLNVSEARQNDPIRAGRVLIAPMGAHLVLQSREMATLSADAPVNGHRPSGTVMFRSIARICPSEAIGIVLSGMGSDGADGLLELHKAGGLCVAQDEQSSVIFGMPRAAIECDAVDKVLDIGGISDFILSCGGEDR
jgi:two-component system, chemotaxis family, protein-glutamate methylesterase/glutaminase